MRASRSEPEGVTVAEAVEATGAGDKTIRRDLIMLRKVGFDLEETVGEYGRKSWRIRQPFERLRSKRRQYQSIRRESFFDGKSASDRRKYEAA